jgi:TPP-dependent pyruvate/acetoin dehydrogenase alpha subunit
MDMVESRQWTKEELKEVDKSDPVLLYEAKLLSEGVISSQDVKGMRKEIKDIIAKAAEFGLKSEFPKENTVKDYVYAD